MKHHLQPSSLKKNNRSDPLEYKGLLTPQSRSPHGADDDYLPNNFDDYTNSSNRNSIFDCNPRLSSCLSVLRFLCRSLASCPLTALCYLFAAILVILLVVVLFFRQYLYIYYLRHSMNVPSGLYSHQGHLYVGENTKFFLKGVSWFGMEEENHVLRGLNKVSIDDILLFLKKNKFNAIRLPLSLQNLKDNPVTTQGLSTFHNPDFPSLNYIDTIHLIVNKAAKHNMLILLDMHRLNSLDVASKGVWYDNQSTEDDLVNMWKRLAIEFSEDWNIIGCDLYNEPWNATWNDDKNDKENWKNAVERIGNQIHKTSPSWLLFIEGVGNRAGNVSTGVFWSENLAALQGLLPDIKANNKFVFSPHVYGPSVFMQDYFKSNNFTEEMPKIWDDHFGQSHVVSGVATVIGEWGGKFKEIDRDWQNAFFSYLKQKEIGFFYWCLNPESSDTGGLLHDDWTTPEMDKLALIANAPSTSVDSVKEHFKVLRTEPTH